MLTERIIGAFTFRKGVYAEVERDISFTTTAWLIVAVVAFLNQLGSQATSNVLSWLFGAILGAVGAVAGFALGAWVISWVGKTVFNADVTFEELVRTLGLAYVWQAIGFFAILGRFSEALGCLLTPILLLSVIAMLAAWLIAAKEALDLEWVETIITVVIGWIALLVVTFAIGAIVGLLGLGAAAVGGVFGL